MKASVQLLRRFGTKLRARDLAPSCFGMLLMDTTMHRKEGPITRLALREVSNSTAAGLIAELMEPTLLGLGHGRMRFRGIERINTPDGPAGVVQEWLVSIDDPPPATPASDTSAGA